MAGLCLPTLGFGPDREPLSENESIGVSTNRDPTEKKEPHTLPVSSFRWTLYPVVCFVIVLSTYLIENNQAVNHIHLGKKLILFKLTAVV